ncbi:hypothetical protein DPMN_117782 [Dreissena polymorpha]|uniref:Uncharacterized protein n=1 Tax=Dreissena polymorpha TaxID=45954 RepID=A0A9D4GIY2_DREPO|nr:hypothetical protein DPMN_117782 [Dreissena polymorpha]
MCKQGAGSRGHTVMPYNANSIVVHNSGLGHPAPSYNSDSVARRRSPRALQLR